MADFFTFSADIARRLMRMLLAWERNLDDTPNRRKRRPIGDEGSGGGSLVLFELVTVDCDAGTATGTAVVAACTGTLPTGTQDITDDLGCFLTGAELLLVGMRCWCQESDGAYGCDWSIVSMCCADATC